VHAKELSRTSDLARQIRAMEKAAGGLYHSLHNFLQNRTLCQKSSTDPSTVTPSHAAPRPPRRAPPGEYSSTGRLLRAAHWPSGATGGRASRTSDEQKADGCSLCGKPPLSFRWGRHRLEQLSSATPGRFRLRLQRQKEQGDGRKRWEPRTKSRIGICWSWRGETSGTVGVECHLHSLSAAAANPGPTSSSQ
jgi:hypothetical protein